MNPSNHPERSEPGILKSKIRNPKSKMPAPLCAFLCAAVLVAPAPAAQPVLTDISLTHSYTCGPRYFRLHGADIELGATIKLVQAGQPDIIATDVLNYMAVGTPVDYLIGTFDLSDGTAGGFWSVTAINPGGESATLADVLEVVPNCPRGAAGDLYVCNSSSQDNIIQFDGMTGLFVCIFAECPPDLDQNTFRPFDLAWAPNGHLWVTSATDFDNPNSVIEYDGNTGAFGGYIVPPTTPSEGLRDPLSLSLGGLNARLYLASPGAGGPSDAAVYCLDEAPPGFPVIVLEPEIAPLPVMVSPPTGRFASNGNYLLLGTSITTSVPTFREFDGQTLELVRDLAIDVGSKDGVTETPDGFSYLVTENRDSRVDGYDIAAGQLAGTFIPRNPALDDPQDPMFYQAMRWPWDIAFGPNGHVYVSAEGTWVQGVPPYMEGNDIGGGGVHVFDPVTGDQIGLIGHLDSFDGLTLSPEKLLEPHGMEFKPMPGDYASSGGAFGGDWVVEQSDFDHFAENLLGPGVRPTNPHALLSFDHDRDGDLDLQDFAAFQRLFGTTLSD